MHRNWASEAVVLRSGLKWEAQEPTTTSSDTDGTIVVPLRDLSDLLNPKPSPLIDGAVTPEAMAYILGKAKQVKRKPIRLELVLPLRVRVPEPSVLRAVNSHFRNAEKTEDANLRELFRYGCKALLIGLLIVASCLLLAWYFSPDNSTRPFLQLLQESLIILGWVSMWRPIEIFLYEWLPLVRQRNLYARLADAVVKVRKGP